MKWNFLNLHLHTVVNNSQGKKNKKKSLLHCRCAESLFDSTRMEELNYLSLLLWSSWFVLYIEEFLCFFSSRSLKSRVKIMVDGTLLISSVVPGDSGNYTCMPTNGLLTPPTASAYLTVMRTCSLQVVSPPNTSNTAFIFFYFSRVSRHYGSANSFTFMRVFYFFGLLALKHWYYLQNINKWLLIYI